MLVLLWTVVLITTLVIYLRKVYSKLSDLQMNHPVPVIPFLGNMVKVTLRREHFTKSILNAFTTFPDDRLVGYYEMLNALILIKDPDLLKSITVKDFEHFVDRRAIGATEDPVFGRNLLLLKGDEWKAMRSTLSPAFTSSKIRLMVPFMLEVGDNTVEYLENRIKEAEDKYIDVDVKDLTSRYANDVIATCAFGLKVSSQSVDNEFYKNARSITKFDYKRMLKFVGFRSMPALMKKLKIRFLPKTLSEFFSVVVLDTIQQRERHNIVRNDMINLLIEAKKGKLTHDLSAEDAKAGFATVEESEVGKKDIKKDWTDGDLVAQAVMFLIAGYETVSNTISFMLHELAINPDIQQRLVQEIKENEEKKDGKLDYNSIQNMVFLDMVVSESLRKWPPIPMVDRTCVKPYNAGRPNNKANKDFIVPKGQTLTIPVFSFHRDPRNFSDPERFDPERFSEQNRHSIKPFTYLPFGLGPRNCIASRFALCEVKVLVYQLLLHVEVSPCAKTCIAGQLDASALTMRMKGGHWLRFTLRQ